MNYDRLSMFGTQKKKDGRVFRKYSKPEYGNFYTSEEYNRFGPRQGYKSAGK